MAMRNLMNIVSEAGRKTATPAPIDLNALYGRINAVAVSLSRQPFAIKWDRSVVDAVTRRLRDMKNQYEKDISTAERPDDFYFNASESVEELAQRAYSRLVVNTFSTVDRDLRHSMEEYQNHHAEKNSDRGRDPSNFIESSDWLSAMDAQRDAAESMDLMRVTPAGMLRSVADLERFVERFSINISDQGYEPHLEEGMRAGLAATIPLMLFTLRLLAKRT